MKTETLKTTARTTSAHADDSERHTWNATFWDMGFKWQWDPDTYRELCRMPEEKARIRAYVERHQAHLLKAYDADFLINLIHDNKVRRHGAIVAAKAAGKPLNLSCNALKATA